MTERYFIRCATTRQIATLGHIISRKLVYFVERDEADMGLRETVSAIIDGEIEHVQSVFCADDEQGTWRDVSEDVACECLSRAIDEFGFEGGELHSPARDFIECHAADALYDTEAEYDAARCDHAEHGTLHRAAQGV